MDHLYDGVRGSRRLLRAGPQSPPVKAGREGLCAADQAENLAEADRTNRHARLSWPLRSDEQAVRRGRVLALPWYAVFGNHDALLQGNQPRNEALEQLAVGCIKVNDALAAALAQLTGDSSMAD